MRIRPALLCLLCLVGMLFFFPETIRAQVASCSVSVDPSSMPASSSQQFNFIVSFSGASIRWAQFSTNTSNQTIDSGSISGWGSQVTSDTVIKFIDGTLPPSESGYFNINVNSGSSESTQGWTVQLSDSHDGSNPTTCSDSPEISVTAALPAPPNIDSLSVSNVANTSVTVSFNTDTDSTATLDYGPDDNYGTTLTDSDSSTSHTFSVTGLTANTTYHYTVTASNDGGSNQTDDSTFTTAVSASATSTPGPTSTPIIVNTTTTTTTTNTVTLPTPTPTPDKKPPVVTLQKLPDQPYKDPPTITGNAVDNDAVANVEYSIDSGKTWNRVKNITGVNSATAQFTFIPDLPEGITKITVRAKDRSDNLAVSLPIDIKIDRTGPNLTITTDLTHPYITSPLINGTARDPSGESSVEYSIDSGKNWIPVDKVTSASPTETGFSFTPPLQDDGNYSLAVRAKDPLGNNSTPIESVLILDRLPPRIGGFLLSIGPQLLNPDGNSFTTLPGIAHTLTVSMVGGPVEATAVLIPTEKNTLSNNINEYQSISLHRVGNGTIWTGDIIFPDAKTYTLRIHAIDGAKNDVTKNISSVTILPPGQLLSPEGKPTAATITIYTKDSLSGSFIPWDGAAYGQENPKKTDATGIFSFYPPSGTYYLSISRGFGTPTVVTNTFSIVSGMPVSPTLQLPKHPSLTILGFSLPIPTIFRQHISFTLPDIPTHSDLDTSQNGKIISEPVLSAIDPSRSFAGKNTMLVLLNTWAPETPDQIQILEKLHTDYPDLNLLAVFPQESNAAIELFAKRGGYTVPLRADPDGELLEQLSYPSIPSFYTLSDARSIGTLKRGIQTEDQLVNP